MQKTDNTITIPDTDLKRCLIIVLVIAFVLIGFVITPNNGIVIDLSDGTCVCGFEQTIESFNWCGTYDTCHCVEWYFFKVKL